MDVCNQTPQLPEIVLDKSSKPRGRRGRLNLDAKEKLLRLYARGEPTSSIADRFDIDETYVRKLASRYGIRKGNLSTEGSIPEQDSVNCVIGEHLSAYKRARRGFELPAQLEPRYIHLLMSGLSCAEAARRLGVFGSGNDSR